MKTTMKILAIATVVAVLGAFATREYTPAATEWKIDTAHTQVSFEVNHFFTPVSGQFKEFDIKLVFDPNDLANSSVEASINIASVDTGNGKRDDDLRSKNFFNAGEFPAMKFVSRSIKKSGEKEYVASGQLTIKDKTKDVDVHFEVLGIQDHPMRKGNEILGLKAVTTINRTEYGVGTGDWMRTNVVGDEVDITIRLEASRKK